MAPFPGLLDMREGIDEKKVEKVLDVRQRKWWLKESSKTQEEEGWDYG